MNFFRRHPWLPFALLSLAGAIVSLTMLKIAAEHAPEQVPVDTADVAAR